MRYWLGFFINARYSICEGNLKKNLPECPEIFWRIKLFCCVEVGSREAKSMSATCVWLLRCCGLPMSNFCSSRLPTLLARDWLDS